MKLHFLLAAIFASTLGNSQDDNLRDKIESVDQGFWYWVNDTVEYRCTSFICTLPLRTIFTNVTFDEKTHELSIEGYLTLFGQTADTSTTGISGASIYLLNINDAGKIDKLFDLGFTDEEYHSRYFSRAAGHFKRTFTLTKGDVLLVGLPGISGANAFAVGKLNTSNR